MKNNLILEISKGQYKHWKQQNFYDNKKFFPIFKDFQEIMCDLSPGAISLFLYFGLNSDYRTGECFQSIETIAKYFKKSNRSISTWIKELEEHNLILRIQKVFNGPSHTVLIPYGEGSKQNKITNSKKIKNIEKKLPFI